MPRPAATVVLALCILVLAGCSSTPSTPPPIQDFATRQSVLVDALGQIGRPYAYGGADADGFDCSGLVYHVYQKVGVQLPRTAAAQLKAGRRIPFSSVAPGDLVFYKIGGGMHVTIYVGHGEVVQAPKPGETVSIAHVTRKWWQQHYVGTVRILQ